MNLKMLDCFCGMGGVSDGFAAEGFDVTGIDIVDAPKMLGYKYNFIRADLSAEGPYCLIETREELKPIIGNCFNGFDVIWGSPPCRNFTILNDKHGTKTAWKMPKNPAEGLRIVNAFLKITLNAKPKFWIMENVFGLAKYLPGAKISMAKVGGKRHVFYGNFPAFLLPESSKFKVRESCGWDKLQHWKRSKIPLTCSRAFARACREALEEEVLA